MPVKKSRPLFIEPFDLYLFGRGEHWDLYRILGAHPHTEGGESGFRFAVWAPNAKEVYLAGEFNFWAWGEIPLYPVGSSGIWAAFVPGISFDLLYKFGIKGAGGEIVYKADPFAFASEYRPGTASVTRGLGAYQWHDAEWMTRREKANVYLEKPLSIYEVHAGSWRRRQDPFHPFISYGQMEAELVPYVQNLGFTHIEFMPLAEHPLDQSWGYQTGQYYSPTSRFGSPDELRRLIDACHQAGIGVILDWVPAHFPKDFWGLARFDGTALYEHEDPRLGLHPDWGTLIFNYGRHEVRNFLLANALYWLKEFHLDGLRMDAVASMIYLDYSRREGEWQANSFGGRENLEAVSFLRDLNSIVHSQAPGAITLAEESTAWPGVSRPVYAGGLGFTFKWNMGWMHDTLEYMRKDPIHRKYHHNNLTFSFLYAFSENFLLPLSHDEVVHGKGALLSKMPGDMWRQQANLRLLYAYMWAHPGKKLLFMGGEFGQWNEWSERRELDWALLDFPAHRGIHDLVRDLNILLRTEPAMHRQDYSWRGFSWLDCSDSDASVYSFARMAEGCPPVVWVFNCTPVVREGYSVPCPAQGRWRERLNTDWGCYGGSNVANPGILGTEYAHWGQGRPTLSLNLPPLAAMAFLPERE
ncbi:MAG: 1,4-alpha-glucan branching protein GlgB [Deltaproteobacteria bacterium]|jgi:1,4-alpha-glucan branching enzyme|nr:1,4-alpha-glucan branching protein GlgB [Deltaproteobacteria bacterium]